MSHYETAMAEARRLHMLATSDDFEVPEFVTRMMIFNDAADQAWPDVPLEVLLDALGNFGPEGLHGAVAKYRLDHNRPS